MSDLEQSYSDEEFDYDALQAVLDEDAYDGGDWDAEQPANDYQEDEFGEDDDEKNLKDKASEQPTTSPVGHSTLGSPTEDDDYTQDNDFTEEVLSPLMSILSPNDEDNYEDDTEPQTLAMTASPNAYPDDDYTDANDFDTTEPANQLLQTDSVDHNGGKVLAPATLPTANLDDEMDYTDDNDFNEDLEPTPLTITPSQSPLYDAEETYFNASPVASPVASGGADGGNNNGSVLITENTAFEDVVATILNDVDTVKENAVMSPIHADAAINETDIDSVPAIAIGNGNEPKLSGIDLLNEDDTYSNTSSQENLYQVDPSDYDTEDQVENKDMSEFLATASTMEAGTPQENQNIANNTSPENLYPADAGDYDAYSDDTAIDENTHSPNLAVDQNSPEAEALDGDYSKSNTSSQDKLYALDPDEYDTYSDVNASDENKQSTEQCSPEADGGYSISNTSSQEQLYALEHDENDTNSDGNHDRKNITELESLIESVLPVDHGLTENSVRISTLPQENEYTEETYENDLDIAGNIDQKIINELETSTEPSSLPELSAVNDNHTLNNTSPLGLLYTTGFDDNGTKSDAVEEPKGVDEYEHPVTSASEPVDSPNDSTTYCNSSSRERLHISDANAFENNNATSGDTNDDDIIQGSPPTLKNDQIDNNAGSKDKPFTTEFDEYTSESLVDQSILDEPKPLTVPIQPDTKALYDDDHTYSNASSQENLYTTGTDEYDGYSDGAVDDKPIENTANATSESGNDQQWSYESSGEGSDNDDGYTYDDAMKEPMKDTISYPTDDDAGKDIEDYYNTRNAIEPQQEDILNLENDKLDQSIVHHADEELETSEMLNPINEVNKTTHDELLNSTAKALNEADTTQMESIGFGVLTEKGPSDELNKSSSSEIILPLRQDFKQDDPLGSEKSASPQIIEPSSSSRSLRDHENIQAAAEPNLQNSSPPSPNPTGYELHHEKSAFDLSDQYQLQASDSVSNLAITTSNLLPNLNPTDDDNTVDAAIEILQEDTSKAEIEPNLSFDNIEQMSVVEQQTSKFAEDVSGQDCTASQPGVAIDVNTLLHQELNENLLPSASPCESSNSQAEYVTDEFLYDISPTPPSNNSRRNSVDQATENWDNYEPEVIEDETTKMIVPAEENDCLVNSTTSELIPQSTLKEIDEVKSNSQLVITTTDLPLENHLEPTPPSEPIPNEAALDEYEEKVKVSTEAMLPAEDENEYNADFVENAPQGIITDDTLATSNDQPRTNLYDEESLIQLEPNTPIQIVSDDPTEIIVSGESKPASNTDYEDEYVNDANEATEDEAAAIKISSQELPAVEIPVIASDNYDDVFEADEGSNQSNIDPNVAVASLSGLSGIEQSESISAFAQEFIPQVQNSELVKENSNDKSDCFTEEVLVPQVAEAHSAQETYEEWSEDAEYNESVDTNTEKVVETTALNAYVENHVEPISSGVETTNDVENTQDEAIIQSVHLEDTPSESNEGAVDENEEEDQVLLATIESLKKDATRTPSSGDNYLDEFRADDDDDADDNDINIGEAFYEEGFDEEPFESLASIRAKLGLPEAQTSNITTNTSTQETQSISDEHKPPVVVTTDEPNNPQTEQAAIAIPIDDATKVAEPTIDTDVLISSTDENKPHQDTPNQSELVIAAMHDNQKPLADSNAATTITPTPERISALNDIEPNSDSQTKNEYLESSTVPNSNQITETPPSAPCASNVSRRSFTKPRDITTPTLATRSPVTPRKPATQKDRAEKDNRKNKTLTPPLKEVSTPSVNPAPSKLETKLKSRILASKPKKVEIADRPPPPKPPVPRQTKVAAARPVENVAPPVRPKTATNLYHCPPTLSPRLPLDSKSAMAFNSPQKDYRPWRQDKPKSPKKKPVVVAASPPKVRFEPKVDKVKEEWLLLNMFRQGDASKYESFCHIPKHVERPSSADLQLRQSASYQTSTRKLVDPKKRSEQLSLEARERNWVDIPNRKTPIPAYEAILDKYCHTITSPYVQKQIYNTVNLSPQLAYVLEKRVQQQRQAEVAFLKQSPKMKPTRPSKPSPNPSSSHSSNDIVSLRWSNLSASKD